MAAIDRIYDFISYKGISVNEFSINVGVSNGYFAKQKSALANIGSHIVEKLVSSYPELNADWLITGRGSMLCGDTGSVLPSHHRHLIPLYDITAVGGREYDADLTSTSKPANMIDTGDWFLDASAAMGVQGDSMSPEYKSGSIVALKEIRDRRIIMFGEDYVVETDEIRVIKRLQRSDKNDCLLACSINPEIWESGPLKGRLMHEPFDIPLEAVRRIYLVLGEVRRNHSFNIINVTQ